MRINPQNLSLSVDLGFNTRGTIPKQNKMTLITKNKKKKKNILFYSTAI